MLSLLKKAKISQKNSRVKKNPQGSLKKTPGFSTKTQGFSRKLNASEATSLSWPPKNRSINKPAESIHIA